MRAAITFKLTPGKAYVIAAYDPDQPLAAQRTVLRRVEAAEARRAWYAGTQGTLSYDSGTFLLFRSAKGLAYLQGQPRTCYACGDEVDKKTYCRRCYFHHCRRCGKRQPRGDHKPEDHQ